MSRSARSCLRTTTVTIYRSASPLLTCHRFEIDVVFAGNLLTSRRIRQRMKRRLHELFVRGHPTTGAFAAVPQYNQIHMR